MSTVGIDEAARRLGYGPDEVIQLGDAEGFPLRRSRRDGWIVNVAALNSWMAEHRDDSR